MTEVIESKTHHLLKLKQIAAWQVSNINNTDSEFVVGVPSLQRGAVWEPQQVEMLWDSILRGFPIGSIVIAKKIENQRNQFSVTRVNEDNRRPSAVSEYTHHILDGQQRCNAIAWGFADPWEEDVSDDFVLWLDILPGDKLKKSTRKYLFRVTTKAHPWGFRHDNNSSYLSHEMIGEFINRLIFHHNNKAWPEILKGELICEYNLKRPSPKVTFPFDANFPVPMSLLFKHFENGALNWDKLAEEKWLNLISMWSGITIGDLTTADKDNVEDGLSKNI